MENKSNNEISEIIFTLDNIEVIKINKEGFYYMNEKVEDVHNVYEKFNEWLEGYIGELNINNYKLKADVLDKLLSKSKVILES